MNFGLDYDGCADQDPALFKMMVHLMRQNGHEVHIVTMRYPSESVEMIEEWKDLVDSINCTCRMAKKPFMEKRGIKINVWIDDNPRAVNEDAVSMGLVHSRR